MSLLAFLILVPLPQRPGFFDRPGPGHWARQAGILEIFGILEYPMLFWNTLEYFGIFGIPIVF